MDKSFNIQNKRGDNVVNETNVRSLLRKWEILIEIGEQASKTKAAKNDYGLMTRIKRTTGQPVVFDFDTYEDQKEIQKSLCQELPQWSDVILSKPEIMDGYAWTRGDFIDLYYEHFRLVVDKLKRIIDQETVV